MKAVLFFSTAVFAMACLVACNNTGQRNASDSIEIAQSVNDSTAMVNNDDAEFAVKAADAGLAEIELAKLALENASDERIIALAEMIVEEHQKIHEELETLADKHNITLPPVVSNDQAENQRELLDKSGPEFDRRYIALMTKEHGKVVSLFEDAASDAQHPDVKAFAADKLPELERHHEHAMALRDSMLPPVDPATAPVVTP